MSKLPAQVAINIFAREGGFTVDQGGPTQFGITLAFYKEYCDKTGKDVPSQSDLKALTKDKAQEVFDWAYTLWGIDQIEDINVVDLLFDSCWNHGPKHPIMWAQTVANNGTVADGVLGPKSAAAINANPKKVYYGILRMRIVYYAKITEENPDDNLKDIVGWMNRAVPFIKAV